MLQLKNHSPFCPSITLFADENGIDTLYVIVKATFVMNENITLAEDQVPPQQADEYWGEPNVSSLKYMSEMHLRKPATDIIVNGHAYAPEGNAVYKIDCGVKVGSHAKRLTIFGNRYWQGAKITSPEPFVKMPLLYENAYGGAYIDKLKDGNGGYQQIEVVHAVNPVGCGYRKPGTKPVDGEKLPNLENPHELIGSPGDQPQPVGMGYISATWKPRVDFAGTYDDVWQKKRAPYLPTDFDNRFFSAAQPELTVPGYLKGGEPVILVHLSQQKQIQLTLPVCELRCEIRIAGATETPEFNLETILFEPDENRFFMTWRAQLNCDKKALKISEVHIHGNWDGSIETAAK